jgi:hypothetical protein
MKITSNMTQKLNSATTMYSNINDVGEIPNNSKERL